MKKALIILFWAFAAFAPPPGAFDPRSPQTWYLRLLTATEEEALTNAYEIFNRDRADEFLKTIPTADLAKLPDRALEHVFSLASPGTLFTPAGSDAGRLATLWATGRTTATSYAVISNWISLTNFVRTNTYRLAALGTGAGLAIAGHELWGAGVALLTPFGGRLSRLQGNWENRENWRRSLADTARALQLVKEHRGPITPELLKSVESMLTSVNGMRWAWHLYRGKEADRLYGLVSHDEQMIPDYLNLVDSLLAAMETERFTKPTDSKESKRQAERVNFVLESLRYSLKGIEDWARANDKLELALEAQGYREKAGFALESLTEADASLPPPGKVVDNILRDEFGVPIEQVPVAKPRTREVGFRAGKPGAPITAELREGRFVVEGFANSSELAKVPGVWMTSRLTPDKFFFVPLDKLKTITAPKSATIQVWKEPWNDGEPLLRVTDEAPATPQQIRALLTPPPSETCPRKFRWFWSK